MNTKPTVIDRFVGYGIDRAAYAITKWNKAFPSRSQRALPPYVGEDDYGSINVSVTGNESALRHRALTLSWIYADVDLIAKEFASAGFGIKEQKGEDVSDVVNHPFETLLANPNDEMTGAFLLQYTAWWMQLRGKAFWYLAPNKDNKDEIVEIWPLPADRVEVVKGKTTFIDRYTYKLRRGTKIDLNPDYVVYFRFPNPYDLWDGLAPLDAALNPLEIDQAEAKWQRDTYVNGRGIPASVLMLSEKMGDRDFAVAAQRIREDFEQGRKLAIARGSDLKVASIGITPQQLGLIESRQFTRDEIDTVFLGLAYHGFSSETGIVVADKILKEKKIWPMHVLMAGQMTTQLVRPFYGDEFLLEFDDIRPQDRSLDIQEFDTYSRVMTLNEARKERKLDDYENEMFPELGNMPVKLATDPSFVLQYFPPKNSEVVPSSQELLGLPAPEENRGIGSLPQSDTAGNVTNNAAERGTGDVTGVNEAKGGVGSGNFNPGQGRGVGKPDGGSGAFSKTKFQPSNPNGSSPEQLDEIAGRIRDAVAKNPRRMLDPLWQEKGEQLEFLITQDEILDRPNSDRSIKPEWGYGIASVHSHMNSDQTMNSEDVYLWRKGVVASHGQISRMVVIHDNGIMDVLEITEKTIPSFLKVGKGTLANDFNTGHSGAWSRADWVKAVSQMSEKYGLIYHESRWRNEAGKSVNDLLLVLAEEIRLAREVVDAEKIPAMILSDDDY